MKLKLALTALLSLSGPASQAQNTIQHKATLETPNYIIRIEEHCHLDVNCQKVKYIGTSKRTGNSITLWGRRLVRMCADQVTPCHPTGYEFRNKDTLYTLSDETGAPGLLHVTRGKTTLVSETGKWK